ncbi:EthD family reductase [Streptomyces carpinensis]|uniref:EthD family reductase n=1 Tax=Streptomyces carpinensis TaxID=66369 RepID=A0ABV1VZL3_9ACTN|nr:EthD family reductase [Streptomyces carpinensis]
MFHMVVTYNRPADTEAFLEHYRTSHAVKAAKMPGLRSFTWGTTQSLDGSEPAAFLVASLAFDSKDAMLAALGSPEGVEANADMELMPHSGFAMHTYQDA